MNSKKKIRIMKDQTKAIVDRILHDVRNISDTMQYRNAIKKQSIDTPILKNGTVGQKWNGYGQPFPIGIVKGTAIAQICLKELQLEELGEKEQNIDYAKHTARDFLYIRVI